MPACLLQDDTYDNSYILTPIRPTWPQMVLHGSHTPTHCVHQRCMDLTRRHIVFIKAILVVASTMHGSHTPTHCVHYSNARCSTSESSLPQPFQPDSARCPCMDLTRRHIVFIKAILVVVLVKVVFRSHFRPIQRVAPPPHTPCRQLGEVQLCSHNENDINRRHATTRTTPQQTTTT